jgi:hypothetical protein
LNKKIGPIVLWPLKKHYHVKFIIFTYASNLFDVWSLIDKMMEKKVDKFAWRGHFHFITKGVKNNIRCKLLKKIIIIYLNGNKVSLI